jgi:hypothetical protein
MVLLVCESSDGIGRKLPLQKPVMRWGRIAEEQVKRESLGRIAKHLERHYAWKGPTLGPLIGMRAVDVEVTLRQSVSQSVSQSVRLGIEHPCGTCDQILLPVGMFLSEIYGLVSIGRPL